jgi:RNA polymerase sigma-70 factor (ECF subfamily)
MAVDDALRTDEWREAAALVAQMRAGDSRAEDEFVRRYTHGVTVILKRQCGSDPFVEDLRQETFRIALAKIRLGEVVDPGRLSGFVASLARNLAIDHYRRVKRHAIAPDSEAARRLAPVETPGALDRLLAEERAALVRRALSRLTTERDREILRRFYVAGDDKDDLCRELGLSSAHFNRVLYRARERVRELLEKERAGGGMIE